MSATLEFEQNSNGHYEAEFETTGERMAVEVNRKEKGTLLAFARIDELNNVLVHNSGKNETEDILFEVDMPEGVTIKILSHTEVTSAMVTGI